ncbi:MAG TPA: ribonuclease D [Planctomycetota bacterium]|nr:ribonuclease D [Planctomycetota bacterium]
MTREDFEYVDDQSAFDALAPIFASAPVLAVDTESDSLYRYRERVCFLQVAAGGKAYLIDTLAVRDLKPFAEACANPAQVKVLHGADYDVTCLRRDFGVAFENLFDTMVASQLVGREQLGLAALVREFYGVELDKSLTTHDWGRRPLDAKYVRYLADDVVYLEDLRSKLLAELERADAVEAATLEFRRVAESAASREPFDPEGFRRIKGARDLNQAGLSVLRELCILRDARARAEDKPAFKVLGNQTLIDVAGSLPRDVGDLRRIQGFSDFVLRKLGADVIDAVRRGLEGAHAMSLRPPQLGKRPPEEQQAVAEALRAWRKAASERDRRTTMAILPNYLLGRVAEARPRTLDELAAVPFFGEERLRRYGPEIVALTASPPPLDEARRRRRAAGARDAKNDGD